MKPERALKEEQGFHTQLGALCWRKKDKEVQVLLITSRETGRWVIPKGWPMDGIAPQDAALTEAWEEAGVKGVAAPMTLGSYTYDKVVARGTPNETLLHCSVGVYPVAVEKLTRKYPESAQRRRKWFSPKKAALRVDEPGLATLIAEFCPA